MTQILGFRYGLWRQRTFVSRRRHSRWYQSNEQVETDDRNHEDRNLNLSELQDVSQSAIQGLLKSSLNRAQATLMYSSQVASKNSDSDEYLNENYFSLSIDDVKNSTTSRKQSQSGDILQAHVNSLVGTVVGRAQSRLSSSQYASYTTSSNDSNENRRNKQTSKTKAVNTVKIEPAESKFVRYRENPAITSTALAHSLWSAVLLPRVDSAIDATCGNGHDSVALARILFDSTSDTIQNQEMRSELVCIDLQKGACDNTTKALYEESGIDPSILDKHVRVYHTSHASLPRPNDYSSVGLVVYNLGYLPGSDDKAFVTNVHSTLASLVDAALLVRIGGMISVMTYPKTNPEEDLAVRIFVECLALLSSSIQTWKEFLARPSRNEMTNREELLALITTSMERVVQDGDPYQTWRVSEHKKLGMDRAPILLTATRIK